MKLEVTGLDGKIYYWNPSASASGSFRRSKLQTRALELVKSIFPYDTILEEVRLPGTKDRLGSGYLRVDMFLPNKRIIIEVHGQQHYTFNGHFHKSKLAFYRAKARDADKRNWCETNDIQLIELSYNESEDEWRNKIR